MDPFKKLTGEDAPLEARILAYLKRRKHPTTVAELSDHFDRGSKQIEAAIQALRDHGHNIDLGPVVEVQSDVPTGAVHRIDVARFAGKRLRFGVTGDNHLGSKYERLDVLEALFDIWQGQGVDTVLQCGNMIEGEARFNKFDLLVHGMDDQVRYFVERWPRREGMRTLFVAGDDHEGWYVQREGVDIGRYIERAARDMGREDLEYLGYMEADLHFGSKVDPQVIRVMHAGGGSAYATSYTSQKWVESLQGGEKPHIALIGHFHKFNVTHSRNVTAIQVGCTKDQDPFLRKKRIEAHVGGVTLDLELGKDGMFHDIAVRWHPFYDRDFYEKRWRHR